MELLVVGAGAVGRWFAGAVDAEPAFADVDPEAAEAAARTVGGRAVPLDGEATFDAVAVAVPLPDAPDAIATHAGRAEAAVVDLAGAMAEPTAAMAAHAPERERLSLHPLFAPENAPGRIAAVAAAGGPVTAALREDLQAAGNELVDTTPEAHDRAMETVQAKAHAALLAFALSADEVDPALGTPIFERLVEVAAMVTGGEPRVYADIQGAFDGAGEVAEAARRLADADREAFEDLFRDAGA